MYPKWLGAFRHAALCALAASFFLAAPRLRAQGGDEFDHYTVRISGFWFDAHPSGSIHGTVNVDSNGIDLQKDFGLPAYSTLSGKLDWKFTHKNHFYLVGTPFDQTREHALNRTITFQGQTFNAGFVTRSELRVLLVGLGYQYDVIRRRRGHLGFAFQVNALNTTAKIQAQAQAQTINGVMQSAVSASRTLFAPLPVAGPEGRFYLFNSPRVFVEGNVYGMYFFGYGNFLSSSGTIGISLTRRLSINGGYLLGSRFTIRNTSDRLGLRFTQRGAIVGVEFSL